MLLSLDSDILLGNSWREIGAEYTSGMHGGRFCTCNYSRFYHDAFLWYNRLDQVEGNSNISTQHQNSLISYKWTFYLGPLCLYAK